QGKAPNQVAHPRFLVLAGYLEQLRFRKDPLLDAESFDLVGNRAQAQDLGYGRSSLAESLSDLFMGKTKAVAQGLQAVGLFKGCQVLALQVFDERDFQCLGVIYVFLNAGQLQQSRGARSMIAPVAVDNR